MKRKSIFTLSPQELDGVFWEDQNFEDLKKSADRYKNELIQIINNWWAEKFKKIRPLLKIFFTQENYFHKWKTWLAFWDLKWAIFCFWEYLIEENRTQEEYEAFIDFAFQYNDKCIGIQMLNLIRWWNPSYTKAQLSIQSLRESIRGIKRAVN